MQLTLYPAYIVYDPDDQEFYGTFPDITGVGAFGNTLEEVKINLGKALKEYADEWSIPTLSCDFVGLVDIELWT